jgi:hypothetical protein
VETSSPLTPQEGEKRGPAAIRRVLGVFGHDVGDVLPETTGSTSVSPPSTERSEEVWGRAGEAGRGARSDPPQTRFGDRRPLPPPSPACDDCRGMTPRHPPVSRAGATSPASRTLRVVHVPWSGVTR